MKFERRFTREGQDPFGSVEYEVRKSVIRHADGGAASEELTVEVPREWSQTATDILAQKYLRRRDVPTGEARAAGTGSETSVRQVVDRLAGCWTHWGSGLGYFDSDEDARTFRDEIVHMLLHQMAAPNSPQWFNTGLHWKYGITGDAQGHYYVDPADGALKRSADAYSRPQPHACFIQSVSDDLLGENGIYDLLAKEGRIFKYGSGTGTNFSAIRAAGETLKGGGRSSGLMSFLKVFDRAAGAIKSGGTTRRAAKMVCLDMDHPEIEDFILWKSREEAKVAALAAGSRLLQLAGSGVDGTAAGQAAAGLVPEGYRNRQAELVRQGVTPPTQPAFDTGFEGEAYGTVSGQNSNNSVRIPNRFLQASETGEDWELTARTDGRVLKTVKASHLWDLIGLAAWECADPGVQFSDTIGEWHTCPGDGPIRASNPCSEYMFLDDTACNLASLNLVRFQDEDGGLRIEDFRHAVRLWTVVLDISVGMAQFPSPEVARRSWEYRTLGLGYANLGAFLMRAGIPYDSPEAQARTGVITALMGGTAYAVSAEMAAALGAFPRFPANRSSMLRVIRNHARAAGGDRPGGAGPGKYEGLTVEPVALRSDLTPPRELAAARAAWQEACEAGETHGFRNAQVTVLAPTGTIGLLMDCDTTGIEPDFSLVKLKKLSGGGYLEIVNRSVPAALRRLGYGPEETEAMVAYCMGHGTLEGAPHLDPAHYSVFDCASRCGRGTRSLAPAAHLAIMAAAQPFLSGAISKTVNLPSDATVEDIKAVYRTAWGMMIKAVAVYRDASKLSQPLTAKQSVTPANAAVSTAAAVAATATPAATDPRPVRRRLPARRGGYVQEAVVSGHKLFLRTGEYPDGTLGEIFIDMYKEGAAYRGILNCFAVLASKALQYGVPLEELVDTFTFTRFEPAGPVDGHENIRNCTSILDLIFRILGLSYLGKTDFVHVKPAMAIAGEKNADGPGTATLPVLEAYKAGYAGESCSSCGSVRVRRNGTCVVCDDCGTTSGCS